MVSNRIYNVNYIIFFLTLVFFLMLINGANATVGNIKTDMDNSKIGAKSFSMPNHIQDLTSPNLSNRDITLNFYDNGQFTMNNTSNGKWLLFPGKTSFISINIDGNIYIQGTSNTSVNTMDNYISTPLTKVNQNFSYINYTLPSNIKIMQKFELYGKTVKFTTQVKNIGSISHNVKIRYLLDTQLDKNDGSPLYAPTIGVKTYETDFINPLFSMWKGYDIIPNPQFESIGTFSSQPNRIVFAWWPAAMKSAWDYNPSPTQKFYTPGYTRSPESDSSVLLYWDSGIITPGGESSITTFYGTGNPTVGIDLSAVENALDYYKNKVNMFYDGYAISAAEANAKLYKKFPRLSVNVTNYFGYKAGIVSEGFVSSKLKSAMKSLNIAITPEYAELNYLFLNEMYGRVNQGMPEEEIKNIFFQHYMGTAANQQHFFMGNIGISSMKKTFNNNYALAKLNLLQKVTNENLDPSEISLLATGITNSAESMSDFEPLYSDYNLIAKAYQENRVDNVYIYTTQYSGTTQNGAQNRSRINIIDPVTLYGTAFVVTMAAPIVLPRAYQASLTIGAGISSALGSMENYITSLKSVPVGDKAITTVNTAYIPLELPEDMDFIKKMEDPVTFQFLNKEINERASNAYEMADRITDTNRPYNVLEKIHSISIEELNLNNIAAPDPNDARGKMGRTSGTIKFKNNGAEITKFSLIYNINGPTTYQFAIDESVITLAPGETKTVGISYAVPFSELTQMGICGRYILTVTPIVKIAIPTGLLGFNFSAEAKGLAKTGYFYASDIPGDLINSVSTSLISENNLLNEGESFISQYFTLPSTDRVSFLLPYAGSDIDLHIYDSRGRHVGVNYNTGSIDNNIPGAKYSGSNSNPEWITVDQSGIKNYTVEAVAIQTIGNESYSIVAIESPEFPPLVSLNPSNITLSTLPNMSINYPMTISEYGGFNNLTELNVSASDLSDGKGNYIPSSNLLFSIPSNNLSAGSSMISNTSIIITENIPYGKYKGLITVTDSSGAMDNSSITIEVSDPSPTSTAPVQITTNSSDQDSPSISGNRIVWKDKRNGNSDIYMYDLSTSTEKRITTNIANQLYPVISGNRIVWEDKRDGNSEIYMYDLSTSTEKRITTNSAHQWYPDISGNRIVWQDKRNGNWDIYMYDLSKSTEKRITTNSASQTSPSISGNRIVWQDYRNGNWDIYMYDLSTSTEKRITTNSTSQTSPSISENNIVWKDERNGNRDIYMYDLSTSTEKQVTTNSASQASPSISGNRIVWKDKRNGNWDIYMYDLSI